VGGCVDLVMKWFIIFFIALKLLFSSDLNILTFNIHALPPIIARDNPKQRIIKIINSTNSYDIISFQENWIFSKNYLTNISPNYHWFVSKKSGLTIAVSNDYEIYSVVEQFYDDCSGWLFDANDCFAKKGFLHIKIKIDNQILDFYNTHLDAGNSKSDFIVRELQIKHLLNYIKSFPNEESIILVGDLNIDSLIEKEIYLIKYFKDELGLNQVDWVSDETTQLEKLDYIFYRGHELIENKYGVSVKLNGLSDHPPIESKFKLKN
jgi:hypothetical protein